MDPSTKALLVLPVGVDHVFPLAVQAGVLYDNLLTVRCRDCDTAITHLISWWTSTDFVALACGFGHAPSLVGSAGIVGVLHCKLVPSTIFGSFVF